MKDNIIIGKSSEMEEDNLAHLVLESLSRCPHLVGILDVHSGEKITYKVMKDWTLRCAVWLKKQNLKTKDIVCLSSTNHVQDFIPMLACICVGIIYNPWHCDLQADGAKSFFQLIRPRIMFACEETIDMLAEIAAKIGIDCKFIVIGNHPRFPSLVNILQEQSQEELDNFVCTDTDKMETKPYMIFFSSGTTGTPKGTMLPYDVFVPRYSKKSLMRKECNKLWYSHLSTSVGVRCLFRCVKFNAVRIFHKDFEAEETSRIIDEYKVNWFYTNPNVLAALHVAKIFDRYSFPSLEVIAISGSKPSAMILETARKSLPHVSIVSSFGMTELGGAVTMQTKNCKTTDSIGFILENVKFKVVDSDTGCVLGPNTVGELCFKSSPRMLGYYENPEASKEIIDEDGWLHTGDLGSYDEDGEISIISRMKELIICNNNRIFPPIVEEILLKHPGVSDVAVVGAPHPIDTERPVALVVKTHGSNVTAKELQMLPTNYKRTYELSGGVFFVDCLPYTLAGKKDLRSLKKLAKDYAVEK